MRLADLKAVKGSEVTISEPFLKTEYFVVTKGVFMKKTFFGILMSCVLTLSLFTTAYALEEPTPPT